MSTFHDLFSVPVYEYCVDDAEILDTLKNHLLHQRSVNYEESSYSIRGETSHHTRDDMANLDCDWSRQLRALIVKVSNEYHTKLKGYPLPETIDINCWGMCMSKGDYSAMHSHPGADVCGVLWLTIPDKELRSEREGQLILMDPVYARRVSDFSYPHVDVEPKEGYGLVFGPWLEHGTEPFYCDGDRFSIAWNVTVRD